MKKLMMGFVFLSLNVFANSADYSCQVRSYRIDLDLRQDKSTHIWLTDIYNRTTIAQGYAKTIEKKGEQSHYFFYPGNAEAIKMIFLTQDTINLPKHISAHVDTKVHGLLLREKVNCSRR